MKIERFETDDALASALAARLIDAIERNPKLVLGLPTGRTPLGLYRELRAPAVRGAVDWSGVRTFNLDEFAGMGGQDPGSYAAFMDAELFGHVAIARRHIGRLDGRAADPVAECRRYQVAIADAGGIDIMILGIGANGHIGFNEPADELHAHTHVAILQPATREANAVFFGGDAARVPERALSMGMATILGAREIVMVAVGAEKSACVERMINDLITPRLPASFLQVHPRVTVMLDRGAASRLP